MAAVLSKELKISNPHLSIGHLCDEGTCDLLPQDDNNYCPEIIGRSYTTSSSKQDGCWVIERFNPPINPCAECPIARNITK